MRVIEGSSDQISASGDDPARDARTQLASRDGVVTSTRPRSHCDAVGRYAPTVPGPVPSPCRFRHYQPPDVASATRCSEPRPNLTDRRYSLGLRRKRAEQRDAQLQAMTGLVRDHTRMSWKLTGWPLVDPQKFPLIPRKADQQLKREARCGSSLGGSI
jgi:hypothetical protein